MLCAAETDALGAELARIRRVLAGVGIGTHAQFALTHGVGPLQNRVKLWRRFGGTQLHCANDHIARGAIEGDHIALLYSHVANAEGLTFDSNRIGADDRRSSPAAGDDRSVTYEASAGGENAL